MTDASDAVFQSIIDANYGPDYDALWPHSRQEAWALLTSVLQGAVAIDAADVVTAAMCTIPHVRDTWNGDPIKYQAWVNEHVNDNSPEWWDHVMEASRVGLSALRQYLADHDIKSLRFFARMPWGDFMFTVIPCAGSSA